MSICSGRWWCGACPEPTSCLFTSTSIHQSGILIYRPSKRLGSSSSTTHSHLSKQLTQTHAVSQSCFTHRTWTNGSATMPWTAVRVLDWIGLEKEALGAGRGLDSTSLLAACLYTCQAGAIRAFPSSSNISPAQSPVYHQKRLMTFFLCYHFTNPSSSPKTAGKYLYCIHYIQERIRDTGRSVKFIWGDHASQATVCYNIIQKNPFFWVLYSKARFLNKPRNKTTHQLDKQLNWTNSLTTKSPSLKANQSRNGIDPLDRSSKSGPLHNQLNLTSWHLSCTKTRTARLPVGLPPLLASIYTIQVRQISAELLFHNASSTVKASNSCVNSLAAQVQE